MLTAHLKNSLNFELFGAPLSMPLATPRPEPLIHMFTILVANSVGQTQNKKKGFSKQQASMTLSVWYIYHIFFQISYDMTMFY